MSEYAAGTAAVRKRAIARTVAEVAGYLGNTPAVARASYIDPRVIELYESGITIGPALRDLGRDSEFGDLGTRGAAERGGAPAHPARLTLAPRHIADRGLSPSGWEAARGTTNR